MNKILPLVTTLLLLNLSRAYSHDDNASSLKLLIGKYKTSLDSVETVYKETMKELDTKKTRFSADNETTSLDLSSKIKFLEGKISSIEQERKLDIEANEAEVQKAKGILNTRYKAGLEAIVKMENGVKIITFIQDFITLQSEVQRTENLWSDSTFSNTYDKINNYGSILGIVGSIGGLFAKSNTDQKNWTAGGLGLVGLSKMIGSFWGDNNGDIVKKKLQFIELTRRSYDDMKVIDFVVKNYINENNSLIDTLKDLHKEYINTKDTSGAIMRVISNLDRFELVLSQIPNLILRIKSLHEGYVARFPDMSPIFQNILAQADKCKARYDSDVKPILEVTPELKNDILFSNL